MSAGNQIVKDVMMWRGPWFYAILGLAFAVGAILAIVGD